MSWAQHVEAIQKQLETGNGLRGTLANGFAKAVGSTIGTRLNGSTFLGSVPLPTLFSFQRTVDRIYNIFRSSPTDS